MNGTNLLVQSWAYHLICFGDDINDTKMIPDVEDAPMWLGRLWCWGSNPDFNVQNMHSRPLSHVCHPRYTTFKPFKFLKSSQADFLRKDFILTEIQIEFELYLPIFRYIFPCSFLPPSTLAKVDSLNYKNKNRYLVIVLEHHLWYTNYYKLLVMTLFPFSPIKFLGAYRGSTRTGTDNRVNLYSPKCSFWGWRDNTAERAFTLYAPDWI